MLSDALALPSDDDGPEIDRTLPAGVTLAADVDLDSDDPCRIPGRAKRQCVAERKAGGRCSSPAITARVTCAVHSGLLVAAEGGKAKGRAFRRSAAEAENRKIEARLGTRAVVASALQEKHAEIRLAISVLADMAASGDRQAALALIPWVNQGLGMPSTSVTTEVITPDGGAQDLKTLTSAQLRALLATNTPHTPQPEG